MIDKLCHISSTLKSVNVSIFILHMSFSFKDEMDVFVVEEDQIYMLMCNQIKLICNSYKIYPRLLMWYLHHVALYEGSKYHDIDIQNTIYYWKLSTISNNTLNNTYEFTPTKKWWIIFQSYWVEQIARSDKDKFCRLTTFCKKMLWTQITEGRSNICCLGIREILFNLFVRGIAIWSCILKRSSDQFSRDQSFYHTYVTHGRYSNRK